MAESLFIRRNDRGHEIRPPARPVKRLLLILVLLAVYGAPAPAHARQEALRVLTINVWSGLDYKGFFKSGEYESRETREARFRSLVEQIRELSPDIIFVQEANPVGTYARRLSAMLDMDEVHQVVNGGEKIGSFGIPVNLKEGLVILARRRLSLKKVDAWKLSGAWGIHTDFVSFHCSEAVIALVAAVTIDRQEVTLVNVHLAASPRMPGDLDRFRKSIPGDGPMSDEAFASALETWRQREQRRFEEMEKLLDHLGELPPGTPFIVAGDFNDGPRSRVITTFREKGKLGDVLGDASEGDTCTWDPDRNTHIRFTTRRTDARGKAREGYELMAAMASSRCVRLDYIFLSDAFPAVGAGRARIVMTGETGGPTVSDHFGVFALVGPDQ